MSTVTGQATVGGVDYPVSAPVILPSPVPPPTGGMIVGATTGQGAGNAHATPDLAGWKSYQAKTGTFASCTKLFDVGAGYPNLPTSWTGVAPSLVANNGGHPVMILYAFNNVPTTAQFVALFHSLPDGQRPGFVHASAAAHSGPGINGTASAAKEHTIRTRLHAGPARTGCGP